jgi:hypothetical protein
MGLSDAQLRDLLDSALDAAVIVDQAVGSS